MRGPLRAPRPAQGPSQSCEVVLLLFEVVLSELQLFALLFFILRLTWYFKIPAELYDNWLCTGCESTEGQGNQNETVALCRGRSDTLFIQQKPLWSLEPQSTSTTSEHILYAKYTTVPFAIIQYYDAGVFHFLADSIRLFG